MALTPETAERLIQALLWTLPGILFFAFVGMGVAIVMPKMEKHDGR